MVVWSLSLELWFLVLFLAACAFGTYGPNCEHQCNCKGDTCDPETGLCPSGCSEGRMGPKCDQGMIFLYSNVFEVVLSFQTVS